MIHGEDVFSRCEGSAGKLLARHFLGDCSRLGDDVSGRLRSGYPQAGIRSVVQICVRVRILGPGLLARVIGLEAWA